MSSSRCRGRNGEIGHLALVLTLVGLLGLVACGSEPVAVPPQPPVESLDLSPDERERYSPVSFDKLIGALDEYGDDPAAEAYRRKSNGAIVGWSGVVEGSRLVSKGLETSEFGVSVSPPSQAAKLFASTVQVVFEVPNGHPVTRLAAGDPVVFVGRLEFDGRTREPWVLDARLVEIEPDDPGGGGPPAG